MTHQQATAASSLDGLPDRKVSGAAGPCLVFVHGFGCAHDDWHYQVSHFSPARRCIAVDLPGHGEAAQGEPTIFAMAGAVMATLKRLDVGEAVLVGHSMGCRVALEICRRAPAMVSGLVFLDGSLLATNPAQATLRLKEQIDRIGFAAVIDRMFDDFVTASTPGEVRARLAARRSAIDPLFHRDLLLDAVAWDAARALDALRAVAVPVLAIQSTAFDENLDRVSITPAMETIWMKAIRENVAEHDIEIVPDTGHFVMLESPAATNGIIARFLSSRVRSSPIPA